MKTPLLITIFIIVAVNAILDEKESASNVPLMAQLRNTFQKDP